MGSGASKAAASDESSDAGRQISPPEAPSTKEQSVVEKVEAALSEDEGVYNGFLVETNIKFNLSIPTNAVEGALVLINGIAALIQAFVNRNKFLRAMQGRIIAIEAAVSSLKSRSADVLQAALSSLQNLVNLLVDYKQFVRYITRKPEGFFDKAVNFFRAKSDLENLADYDEMFTRALADLAIPLQADQIAMMEAQRSSLQTLSADIARVLSKIDESRVLTISKRVLTHEESLSFWMDCFPDKFQAPVKEFVAALFLWLTESRGMTVSRRAVENIVTSVNLGDLNFDDGDERDELEDAPDEFIDAREANLLFVALPENYPTLNFKEVISTVAAFVKERRQKDIRMLKEARERAARKMEAAAAVTEHSEVESAFKATLGNLFHVRYVCEASSVNKNGLLEKRNDVQCLYITEHGGIQVLGRDRAAQVDASWPGKLYSDLSLELEVPNEFVASSLDQDSSGWTAKAHGQFRGNLFIAHCVLHGGLQATYLRLPTMVRWEGYWELPNGMRGDMFLYLGETPDGHDVQGISDDEAGVAIWRGTMDQTDFTVTKKYINKHFVEYTGSVSRKGDQLRYVKGTWSIPGDWSGTFELWELLKSA